MYNSVADIIFQHLGFNFFIFILAGCFNAKHNESMKLKDIFIIYLVMTFLIYFLLFSVYLIIVNGGHLTI